MLTNSENGLQNTMIEEYDSLDQLVKQEFTLLDGVVAMSSQLLLISSNGNPILLDGSIRRIMVANHVFIFDSWEQRRDLLVESLNFIDLYVSLQPYMNYRYAYRPRDGKVLSNDDLLFIFTEINDYENFRKQSCIHCLARIRPFYEVPKVDATRVKLEDAINNVNFRYLYNNVYTVCDKCIGSIRARFVDDQNGYRDGKTGTWLDKF